MRMIMNFLWTNFMASTIDDLFPKAKGTCSREFREFTIDRALEIVSVQQEIARERDEALFNQRRKWVPMFPGGSASSLPLSSRRCNSIQLVFQGKRDAPREFSACEQRDTFLVCAALVRKWTRGKSSRNSDSLSYSGATAARRRLRS